MADVIHIERGFSPWKPSADAQLVKQYQYYEMPLAGVIEQHGIRYVFLCLAGADENVNFWGYIHLSKEDEEALDSATEDEFNAIDFTGPAVMALAVTGPGIIAFRVLDDLNGPAIQSARHELSEELREWVATASELEIRSAV